MEGFNLDGNLFQARPDEIRKILAEPVATVPARSCICGKVLRVDEYGQTWHSGVVNYVEVTCEDCRREAANHARIVCIRCKTLQGFVPAQRHSSGFEFLKRRHYHIDGCPKCQENCHATPVLEVVAFCRGRGIALTTDHDIVQESEQKTLQGQAESLKIITQLQKKL